MPEWVRDDGMWYTANQPEHPHDSPLRDTDLVCTWCFKVTDMLYTVNYLGGIEDMCGDCMLERVNGQS